MAFADKSLGVWQTRDRKMDYELTLCGDGGTALCVMLTGARGSADTSKVHPYIGRYIAEKVPAAGKNKWEVSIDLSGASLNGTLTLNPGKTFVMAGCAYVVICSDFTLIPAKKK